MQANTIKILQDNTKEHLRHLGLAKNSHTRSRPDTGLYYKQKPLCSQGPLRKNERQPTSWDEVVAHHISDQSLGSRIYKEFSIILNTIKTQ